MSNERGWSQGKCQEYTGFFPTGPGFDPHNSHGGSQPSVAPLQGI